MPENFGAFAVTVIVFLVAVVVLQWWGGSSKTTILPKPTSIRLEEMEEDDNEK